ncbi:MAG TPA: hypothetical protein HA360_03665 [Nanoarchaeota archaeon]|nr:hypothetical protein [Candidatus Woesearchaeota archaeon]HIH14635.1 hypothetical protein [Nanoarchaeota archaeon]HIH59177.1 hypothetical protein [Nanoarchaeota archaeon]HII14145.1 hypothetical protein [Nanoarchaeota archaeon]HIJ05597.1 hypothetical protein [Nanoarchaeota archaeon]
MALTQRDYTVGGAALAIGLALAAVYHYGTTFSQSTEVREERIAGERVEIVSYENNWFGGGKYIRVDGNEFSPSAYKNRLEEMVDKALEEKKEEP